MTTAPPCHQLLPLYVVETMGMVPGLSGLFVSGIFSGSLSTVSSALNSLAAVTYQDYIMVSRFKLHKGTQGQPHTHRPLFQLDFLRLALLCCIIASYLEDYLVNLFKILLFVT